MYLYVHVRVDTRQQGNALDMVKIVKIASL